VIVRLKGIGKAPAFADVFSRYKESTFSLPIVYVKYDNIKDL